MQRLVDALDPAATWIDTPCVCGREVRVPSRLGGRTGSCPGCGRALTTSGRAVRCASSSTVFESNHPERELKRLFQEPNFAHPESAYAIAQRHTVVPGVMYLMATLGVAEIVLDQTPTGRFLGLTDAPGWVVPAWLLACLLAVASATGTAALAFRRATGRSYVEDRIMFSAAGGYDVARWAPLFCYAALFCAYGATAASAPGDVLSPIRDPVSFVVIGAVAGHVVTLLVARWVFCARFMPSR